MKYKLLVLDLDGTLTNAKKEITPRNREALIRVQQQGVKLILASGRPTFGIAPLADVLHMKEYGGLSSPITAEKLLTGVPERSFMPMYCRTK